MPEPQIGSIRYQLLHRTASALIEAKHFNASAAMMLVHAFSQTHEWFEDYEAFAALYRITAERNTVHRAGRLDGIELYLGWVTGDAKYLEMRPEQANETTTRSSIPTAEPIEGIVTARKCECCGHHEMGFTTEEGAYVPIKPGIRVRIFRKNRDSNQNHIRRPDRSRPGSARCCHRSRYPSRRVDTQGPAHRGRASTGSLPSQGNVQQELSRADRAERAGFRWDGDLFPWSAQWRVQIDSRAGIQAQQALVANRFRTDGRGAGCHRGTSLGGLRGHPGPERSWSPRIERPRASITRPTTPSAA